MLVKIKKKKNQELLGGLAGWGSSVVITVAQVAALARVGSVELPHAVSVAKKKKKKKKISHTLCNFMYLYFTYNLVYLFFVFLGLHPRHMEVPRLGAESEL